MSIEKALADQTVAINENTAAVKALIAALGTTGKAAASSAPAPAPAESKPAKSETKPAAKSDLDRAKVNAALTEVKEKKGAPAAKAIIKDKGGVERMADIPEDKFQAVYDAAKAAVKEEEEDGGI